MNCKICGSEANESHALHCAGCARPLSLGGTCCVAPAAPVEAESARPEKRTRSRSKPSE